MPNGGCSSSYSYLWSNGNTSQTITGLCAGNYFVTVSSSNCVNKTASVIVPSGGTLNVSVNQSNVTCNGTSSGAATLLVNGGVLPYTYLWSASAGGQTTATASGLSEGTHTVTITDAAGCLYIQNLTITEPQSLSLFISTTWSCPTSTGTATANVTGGTTLYTYLWNNGQTVQTASGLSAGLTYTVTITDDKGCTTTGSAPITYTPLVLSPTTQNIECQYSGSASVTVSSGKPGYLYAWSNGQTESSAIGLSAGNYTVTVTDDRGCTATQNFTITGSAPLFQQILHNLRQEQFVKVRL